MDNLAVRYVLVYVYVCMKYECIRAEGLQAPPPGRARHCNTTDNKQQNKRFFFFFFFFE